MKASQLCLTAMLMAMRLASAETTRSPEEQRDVQRLCSIPEFALGGIGFSGETSLGEELFRRILTRPDNLESFIKVYVKGNNEAKMYALFAFYHLDQNLYSHIKHNYQNRGIEIRHTVGCDMTVDVLDIILSDFVEKGFYDQWVPETYRKSAVIHEDAQQSGARQAASPLEE